jgi:hydroxyacylglutathione hydrolase
MIFRLVYDEILAQASYLVGCAATGEALIIDPNRNSEHYIALAKSKGLRITAITETHIHADFVSGARELAQATGAQLYLSDMGPAAWKYQYAAEAGAILLHDRETFRVGNIQVEALHTPGHTPEHLSFLLTDTAATTEPMGIFTGDFLFVGDVGRPDLLEKAAGISGTAESGARQLFRSLQRMHELPDYLQIWPGHGAGSACGRALGAIPQTTLGYEKRTNWAFSLKDEERFIQAVLDKQPEPPTYFADMKRINKAGPAIVGKTAASRAIASVEQLAEDLRLGTPVVDVRPSEQYAQEHIPGTINVPYGSIFLTWTGWLLHTDQPFSLIADTSTAQQAIEQLRLIGLDRVAHVWTPEIVETWKQMQRPLVAIQSINVAEARHLLEQGQVTLIDIRSSEEYAAGHIPGSKHIHLGYLEQRLQDIPTEQPVIIQCQGGTRSPIGASLLEAHHYPQVLNLVGGFASWQKAGYSVVTGV